MWSGIDLSDGAIGIVTTTDPYNIIYTNLESQTPQ